MRRASLSFLALGLLPTAPILAQETPKPKPPAASAKPEPPKNPPQVKKVDPNNRSIIEITEKDDRIPEVDPEVYFEFKGLTVEQLVKLIKPKIRMNLSVKDEIKKAVVPDTVFSSDQLMSLLQSLPALVDGLTLNQGDNDLMIIGGVAHDEIKSNVIFLPVSLDPLINDNSPFARIGFPIGGRQEEGTPEEMKKRRAEIADRNERKIQSAIDAVKKGVELDARLKGKTSGNKLSVEIHQETNLLLLGGPADQVEAASKVLAALGLRVNSGRSNNPGQQNLGGSGMGMGSGGMAAPGGMSGPGAMPGMGGSGSGGGRPRNPTRGFPGAGGGAGQPGAPGTPSGPGLGGLGGGFSAGGASEGAPGFPPGAGAPGAPGRPGQGLPGAPGLPGASGTPGRPGAPGAPGASGLPGRPGGQDQPEPEMNEPVGLETFALPRIP